MKMTCMKKKFRKQKKTQHIKPSKFSRSKYVKKVKKDHERNKSKIKFLKLSFANKIRFFKNLIFGALLQSNQQFVLNSSYN